jgi:hypothetical protein
VPGEAAGQMIERWPTATGALSRQWCAAPDDDCRLGHGTEDASSTVLTMDVEAIDRPQEVSRTARVQLAVPFSFRSSQK